MADAATLEAEPVTEQFSQPPFELPLVIVVPEMSSDIETRFKAAKFIGAVTTEAFVSVEALTVEKPIESLHEAIKLANEGDEQARQLIDINVHTDAIERTLKTGHVMAKVPLTVTAENRILQHGQYAESIQANSLRFASDNPIMRRRTEAETRNTFRTSELYKDDYFEEYSLAVFSRAEKRPEFFTETMSCSIQLTGKQGEGLAIESCPGTRS